MDFRIWGGRGVSQKRRVIGLVGKSTEATFLETIPKVLPLPRGISTMWPGFKSKSEE